MHRLLGRAVLRVLVLLVGVTRPALGESPAPDSVASCTRSDVGYVLRYQSGRQSWEVIPPGKARITARDRVDVCIEHFNHLRYTLKFEIAADRSEAYGYLDKLWASILTPSLATLVTGMQAPAAGTSVDPLVEKLQALYRIAIAVDDSIKEVLLQYHGTGLSPAQADTLAGSRTRLDSMTLRMRTAYQDLQTYVRQNTSAFVTVLGGSSKVYTTVTAIYGEVIARADAFLARAAKTVGTDRRAVGTRPAGTRVTLTLAAVGDQGESKPMGDISYLSESTLPLVLHGGLAFSGLNDVTFKRVKRATDTSAEDLFQETSGDSNSESALLFLGAQLFTVGRGSSGGSPPLMVLLSLGTDVEHPGKRLFIGPSFVVAGRLVGTVGYALGKESEGKQQTLEPNVFRVIRESSAAAPFASISVKIP